MCVCACLRLRFVFLAQFKSNAHLSLLFSHSPKLLRIKLDVVALTQQNEYEVAFCTYLFSHFHKEPDEKTTCGNFVIRSYVYGDKLNNSMQYTTNQHAGTVGLCE